MNRFYLFVLINLICKKAKNDFIELGYTMRGLQLTQNNRSITRSSIRDITRETLSKYMKEVESIDEKNINAVLPYIHDKLISILNKSTDQCAKKIY